MTKSRSPSPRTPSRSAEMDRGASEPADFPVQLPDPPRKNPLFLGLAAALLAGWLLALLGMALAVWLSESRGT